jgi:hypothetical protein
MPHLRVGGPVLPRGCSALRGAFSEPPRLFFAACLSGISACEEGAQGVFALSVL